MVDDAIIRAVWRARTAVGELNTSRRSQDIERVRKGVEYELERALRLAGHPWEGQQSPGPVIGGHKGEIVAMDEELPFPDPYAAWTPEQRRALYEQTPPPKDARELREAMPPIVIGEMTVSREPIKYKPPCGRDDKHCGLRGGSAHCGGCRD